MRKPLLLLVLLVPVTLVGFAWLALVGDGGSPPDDPEPAGEEESADLDVRSAVPVFPKPPSPVAEPVPEPATEVAEPKATEAKPKRKDRFRKPSKEKRQVWLRPPKLDGRDWDRTLLSSSADVTALDLKDRLVTDDDLPLIANMGGLEVLLIRYNQQVTDAGIRHLSRLNRLRELMLGGTGLTDEGLAALAGLTSLEVLYLWRTSITDGGLIHLGDLPRLRVIFANNTQIRGTGFRHLASVPLEFLWLEETPVDDEGLEAIGGLTTLRELRLTGSHVTDRGLPFLRPLVKLRTLHLSQGITKGARETLLRHLPHLDE